MREPGGKLEEQPGGIARDRKAQSGHRWVGLKEREIQEFRSVGGGARASGVLDIKEGLEGKEEVEARSICLKISGILGSARGREQYWGTEKRRRP